MKIFNQRVIIIWVYFFLILITFAGMLWLTWGTWPDPVVDFGREAYVPWRLSAGDVLYRDIAYFNGPVSPYFNAMLFKIFGTSLWTIFFANMGLLGIFVILVWNLLSSLANRLTAFVGIIVMLCIFSFGQTVGISNYNFIAPYSHELTHGIILGIASILLLQKWQRNNESMWLVLGGLCAGVAFLTKPETALATLLSCSSLVLLSSFFRNGFISKRIRLFVIFLFASLIPTLISISLLANHMSLHDAVVGTLNPWLGLFENKAKSMPFYSAVSGTDNIARNLQIIASWMFKWLSIFTPALILLLVGRYKATPTKSKVLRLFFNNLRIVSAIIYFGIFLIIKDYVNWFEVARPLPIFLLMVLIVAIIRLRHPNERQYLMRIIPFVIFAFVMLLKIILNVRFIHYGFGLTLPATLLFIVCSVYLIPRTFDKLGMDGRIFIIASLIVLSFTSLVYVERTKVLIGRKTFVVGSEADKFRANFQGALVEEARQKIIQVTNSESTLVGIPEGAMLNFLTRRKNPTPYLYLSAFGLALYGDKISNSLKYTRPDFIALIHQDNYETGYRFFGRDYSLETMSWIKQNYSLIEQIGDTPFINNSVFGIQILKRNF